MMVELVVPILTGCQLLFDPIHSFSARGKMLIAPLSKFKYRPLCGVLPVNKHHIFAHTAGARSMVFPKLCVVIEDVETIKKVPIIFRSNA